MAVKRVDIPALTAQLERNTSLDGSIIALVEAFATEIEAVKGDADAVQAVVDQFRTANDVLEAAVVKHTPADPSPA